MGGGGEVGLLAWMNGMGMGMAWYEMGVSSLLMFLRVKDNKVGVVG